MKCFLRNLDELQRKSVAILGAGISGRGVGTLLDHVDWKYETYDEQGRAFGETEARASSLVVYSPGFRRDHPWLQLAKLHNCHVLGEMDFGASFLENESVAITGTNGKTTLVTLLAHILREADIPVAVAGNLGLPLCELIGRGLDSNSLVILEVSSFQAQGIQNLKPSSFLWTNFEEDHQDHHDSVEEYFQAKKNLLDNARENACWVGRSVTRYAGNIGVELPKKLQVVQDDPGVTGLLAKDHFMSSFPQRENLSLAKRFTESLGIDDKTFFRAISNYEPEPHRLHKVTSIGKAVFWNDSKATNPAATLAACKNFAGNLYWIGGGRSKGEDTNRLLSLIKPFVQKAFLIGEVAESLCCKFAELGVVATLCKNLEEAVSKAYREVKEKTDVLFSPGFASFDLFQDYAERGKLYIESVFDLKKAVSVSTQGKI